MRKIFTFLLALVTSVGLMNAKVTWNSSNISDISISGTGGSYSKEGVTLSVNADDNEAYWYDYGAESKHGIYFYIDATGGYTFSNTLGKNFTKIEMTLTGTAGWDNAELGDWLFSGKDGDPVTWKGNASTVDLLKDVADFNGENVKSIVFYFEGDSEEPATPATPTVYNSGSVALSNLNVGDILMAGVTVTSEKADYKITLAANRLKFMNSVRSTDLTTQFSSINPVLGENAVILTSTPAMFYTPIDEDGNTGNAWEVTANEVGTKVTIAGITYSGTTPANSCGDGLTWELNGGVLTISYDGEGTGEMYDFGYEYDENPVNVAPWKEYKSEITTVVIGDGVKSIGNYAFNDLSENFTAVTIANSVERIGVFAFTNSEEITEITLPSSLKTIDEQGFANCGFTSITIPSGVTSIGYKAFCYCTALTSLTCEATTPPALASSVFYKVRSKTSDMSNIPLYVPSESVAAYEAAAQWNAFDIQGYAPTPTPTGLQVTELQVPASWADNPTMLSISDMPGFVAITEAEATAWDAAPAGKVDLIFAFEDNAATALSFKNGVYQAAQAHNITYEDLYAWYSNGDKIFYTSDGSAPAGTVTVVFEANNNQKEVEVTLPHTFACDFENGNGELDGIIQELYALQYGGYCQAFNVPTATGNEAVTASKDGNNHYIAISEAFEGTATVTGNYIKYLDTEHMGNTSVDYTLTISVQGSTPTVDPEPTTGLQVVEVTSDIYDGWNSNGNPFSVNALPGFHAVTFDEAKEWTGVPTSGTAALVYRTNGDYARVIHFFDGDITGDYDLETSFNQMYENITIFGNRIFYTAGGGSTPTPTPDPTPTPSATGGIFANCYDCWRDPEYPTISGQCKLSHFGNPGVGNGNPSGPWKLEFVEYYNSSSTEYADIVDDYVASEYGKTLAEMEVYRLYQWQNGAYQPVAYGVLYAYANESNPVEHAAFFEANGYWGCYLTGNTHSDSEDINITFNEDASTGFADLHGGPAPAVDPTPTPSGDGDKLAGAFSVGGNKVVYFSKANLQATTADNGSTWTWGFAENQWDYVGDNAANTSFDYWGGTGNGSYDLFGWIGASSALDDYRKYGIGSNYDFTDCGNTAGEDLKADWGSLMGSDWRTLTYDEWQYLIKSRNNAANLLAYATVNGKTGLILLPDSWTSSSVALTITTANYTTNIISASDWSTLEEQGCVFLPAAGSREDTSVSGVGVGGDYWSSSSPSGKQYDEGNAYCFFFDTDFSKQADGMHFNKRGRGYGLSVRLVSETAPSGGSTPAVDPAVQNVIDLINAIPNPVAYNQECFNALNAVYDAYVALSEEQRDQVTNYDDYLAAEERYYMLGSVNNVIETINEIGNVEFTSACKHRIDYARSEYCALTLEAKGYVTNYNTLLAAEAAYAALIPVSSTVVWDEAILETIDADEGGEATYTNGSISLKAVDGHAYYVDGEQHFLFDGSNSEKSFVFSCTSANILRIEITVYEKYSDNELSCAWQETATGYRWVGEATSVDLASTIFKVTEIRFYLGEAFPEPTPTPAQDGDKLPGAFSVSGGKVVYFSKGNLQYLGNIDRWHFAENQWTIIGNAQASNNRDLFSWGTGDNPDSEDYSTYTEWGNNIEGNWRTLTVEEWTYLFNTRTDASSKYGTATVAGVVGLILLPDVYDGTAINTERTAWNNNVISSSEWAAYEAEGAVFLPAAGLSDAYDVYGVGEQGFYWSSTMDALTHYANSVFYGFDGFEGFWFNQVDAQFQPQERHSVRLVSETPPTPAQATENSITINGTPQVGDNSISLTYYFDPANVPGLSQFAPTLKVKCVTDGNWDEKWLSLSDISSGTVTIKLNELGSFQEGKTYDVCFAYYNGSWVDDVFQSFTPATSEPQPQGQTITGGQDPQNTTYYYCTFFDSQVKYELPAGVEAYVATISGDALTLTKIAVAGQTIPANNAVIFRANAENFTLTPSTADAVTISVTNDLKGTDIDINAEPNCYVLSDKDGVIGFYEYIGSLLHAHKAYITYTAPNNAPRRMRFIFAEEQTATALDNAETDNMSVKVIENGQLVIIRNGVRYNAAGQVIE